MIRRVLVLVLLSILVWAGVEFWYGRLKRQLAPDSPSAEHAVPAPETDARQQQVTPDARAVPQAVPVPGEQGDDYGIIVQRNIFGAVLEQEALAKEEEKVEKPKAEKSTLKLTLLGTVSGNERDARAIIMDEKNRKQDIYQIGDAVQGALIESIERGKVILDVDGRRQFLVLKERSASGGGGAVQADGQPVLAQPIQAQPVEEVSRPVPSVKPHRRISFRRSKKVIRPILDDDDVDGAREEGPDREEQAEAMSREEVGVEE